jgi:serine O-acetyltransferase
METIQKNELPSFPIFKDKAYYCLKAWRSNNYFIHYFGRSLLRLFGCELPRNTKLGKNVAFKHNGLGIVIEHHTVIGDRVTIFQQVTIGGANVYSIPVLDDFAVIIEDDVILGAGAKVLSKRGVLTVRRGTVVGANAVLLQSTGEFEIWAGVPARKVSERPPLNYRAH